MCQLTTSARSTFNRSSMNDSALLKRTRRLYPPPTLLGGRPSAMAKSSVLVWSAMAYMASMARAASRSPRARPRGSSR